MKQGDNPVVRLLPSGKKLVVRSGHIQVVAKSEAILQMIEKGIQGAKRQHYNDLLLEMQEFFGEDNNQAGLPAEPTMRILREEDNHGERESPNFRPYQRGRLQEAITSHL